MEKLEKIVETLKANDKLLQELFAERKALIKELTREEKNQVFDMLYADHEAHYDL